MTKPLFLLRRILLRRYSECERLANQSTDHRTVVYWSRRKREAGTLFAALAAPRRKQK